MLRDKLIEYGAVDDHQPALKRWKLLLSIGDQSVMFEM